MKKKNSLELPSKFQEMMIMQELSFNNGDKSLRNIKHLIESYTVIYNLEQFAQEYYDSVDNNMLYTYYNEKLIKLLTNCEVITILDQEDTQRKRKSCPCLLSPFEGSDLELIDQKVK